MKSMKNFVAQQLSKSQMNKIHGGINIAECLNMRYMAECIYEDENGISRKVYGCGDTMEDALMSITEDFGAGFFHDCRVG